MGSPAYSVLPVNSKRCQRCSGLKSVLDFHKDSSKTDGLLIYCRDCQRKINKINRSRPESKEIRKITRVKHKEKERDWALRRRYGITLEQFRYIFDYQGKRCALCRSDKSDKNNFVVDHCHKTGKIRGILCSYCNRALGMFKDSPEVLEKAISYLKGTL